MIQIGFDIGGTLIKAGIVDDQGNVLGETVRIFPGTENKDQVPAIIEEMASEMLTQTGYKREDVRSLGIAVPGSLDNHNEMVLHAYNLGFHQYPLKKLVAERFPKTPVFLVNDGNAATLGELHIGALKGCNTGVLITLGTGVGGGLVLGGRLFNGGMGHGVELGHMRLVHQGLLCTCGNHGCVETVCSAAYFRNRGFEPKQLIDLGKAGDQAALEIFSEYLEYLSDAMVSIAMLLDPEVIAIGGGISQAGDFLFEPLRKLIEEKSFFKYPHRIVPAKLGNKAGFIGASLLGKNNLQFTDDVV